MAPIDFFVKNPAKVTVGVLLMVLFGFGRGAGGQRARSQEL